MSPVYFGGQRSKVKVTIDMYGNKLVNMIEMAALASDCLRSFQLLLWNRWTEFNETWQEVRSQRPLPSLYFSCGLEKQDGRPGLWLVETSFTSSWNRWTEFNETWQEARYQRPVPSLCFSGRSEKQDPPGLWFAETFSTSPLKPLNGIERNLTGSKISTSSNKFVCFGPIRKTRWPPWPMIGWYIFNFSSKTTERNSKKLDRKQDLNVLYQVCVFRANWKKTRWSHGPLIDWDIFDFSSETAERTAMKLDRKKDLNVLYQVFCFWADRKNKMAALKGGTLYSGARYVALWASCFSHYHNDIKKHMYLFIYLSKSIIFCTDIHPCYKHIVSWESADKLISINFKITFVLDTCGFQFG